jgi:hypothetical protein
MNILELFTESGLVLTFLAFFLALVGGYFVRFMVATIGRERLTQVRHALSMLTDEMWALIAYVEDNPGIEDDYIEKADELDIDPRMLYVLDKIEQYIDRVPALGILSKLELEDLYLRAEVEFNKMKRRGEL